MYALKTNWKDINSVNLEVYQTINDRQTLIAEGSYNIANNWAHIDVLDEFETDYYDSDIAEKIESREILIK